MDADNSIRQRHILLGIVLLAFVIRFVHLLAILPSPLVAYHRVSSESDMFVFDQWARRIAQGDILSREIYFPLHSWQLDAAPAAKWMEWRGGVPVFLKAPVYPYLIAMLYWTFGAALLPLVILQIAASTVSVLLLVWIGARLLDRTAGLFAGLLYALYAPAIHYDVFMLRNSLIVLLSLCLTANLISLRSEPTNKKAYGLGFILGGNLLLYEGLLVLPFLLVALLIWWFRDLRLIARLGGRLLLGFGLTFVPLVLRNLAAGAPPVSLAAVGATIFAVSNTADASPYFFRGIPPSFGRIMDQSGGRLLETIWSSLGTFEGNIGAIGSFYFRKAIGLVIPLEYPDNANFYYAALKDPLLRFLPTYALILPLSALGLGLASKKLKALQALFPVALSLVVILMAAHPNSRHRAILAAYLIPFAALALVQMINWLKERRFLPLISGLVCCLLIFFGASGLQERVALRDLRPEVIKYRPHEFTLGAEVYLREKRFREADDELLQLIHLNPSGAAHGRALLMGAKIRLYEGKAGGARQLLESASRISEKEPEILTEIGDFYLRMFNDGALATLHYRKALDLNPSESLRKRLSERLASMQDPPNH